MKMEQPPENKRTVVLGQEKIVLDSERMKFNETTLNDFMDSLGQWYDYFSQKLSEAEALLSYCDWEYDKASAKSFDYHKSQGGSDKACEAKVKLDPEVDKCKKSSISTKHKVTQIKQHLKAWDKAHDNATSRGHMIRKEMDKLNRDIKSESFSDMASMQNDYFGNNK